MTTIQRGLIKPPVHALSALTVVLFDWLVLALNVVTAMDAYWPVSIGTALLAALVIFFIEHKFAHENTRHALLAAACAPPLIVLPFPLAGSVVGLALLLWALFSWFSRRG
jgi:hypothetical protein